MNLFQKYGIKEVADVVFYTITTVGDEDFYTPVLFLDTLKVSTLEKTAEKVEARGGKGNKKLITWNFGKEITLNLEDALFSPASMSMIWGGKLNSKLSDYTSAIVKCNLANKYGDLHYSVKAYPSPALTDDEWEIVFRMAEQVNLDSGCIVPDSTVYIDDGENSEYVAENRNAIIKKYFNRSMDAIYISNITNMPEYTYTFNDTPKTTKNYLSLFNPYFSVLSNDLATRQSWGSNLVSNIANWGKGDVKNFVDYWPAYLIDAVYGDFDGVLTDLLTKGQLQDDGTYIYTINNALTISAYLGKIDKDVEEDRKAYKTWQTIRESEEPHVVSSLNLTFRYQIAGEKIFPIIKAGVPAISFSSNSSTGLYREAAALKEITDPLSFFVNFFGAENIAQSEYENLIPTAGLAMPQAVISEIMSELTSIDRVGYIDTDLHDIEVIDRMEKCIVKDRKGLTISTVKQKENLFKYYADDRTSSYTIYYDAKTMLPLFPIENGIIQDENDEFTIKMGTVYYKWTRTVKYKESDDDAILGKTLVIDAETFPDAYKIVGETYIRNQKTGKDQRYQFTIHRANVSTDTSVTLEAEGDPTTFSMQIDVLTPPNDIMMELKQYDVEDDPLEGGTRIVPQKSKYTYTPTNIKYIEEVADKNEEIY